MENLFVAIHAFLSTAPSLSPGKTSAFDSVKGEVLILKAHRGWGKTFTTGEASLIPSPPPSPKLRARSPSPDFMMSDGEDEGSYSDSDGESRYLDSCPFRRISMTVGERRCRSQ
jgi:hypothetical protein